MDYKLIKSAKLIRYTYIKIVNFYVSYLKFYTRFLSVQEKGQHVLEDLSICADDWAVQAAASPLYPLVDPPPCFRRPRRLIAKFNAKVMRELVRLRAALQKTAGTRNAARHQCCVVYRVH